MAENNFTESQDIFIAQYFQSVGPEILAANDLPHTVEQIKERYAFLLKNRADIFAQALKEEQMFDAVMKYELTPGMIDAITSLHLGQTDKIKKAGRSLRGLQSRGLVVTNGSSFSFTKEGREVAFAFEGASLT